MTSGSCLCGAISFEIDPPAIAINNCHCSICRKASGAAFGSYLHIPADQFRWLSGQSHIVQFTPSGRDPRPFCQTCASRVPFSDTDRMVIPAGLLDGDPEIKVAVNIFTGSKAKWFDIDADLPEFAESAGETFWAPILKEHAQKLRQSN